MKEGWIEERPAKRGLSFRVRYWAPDAHGMLRPKSKSFPEWTYGGKRPAEDAAKTFLAGVMTEVRRGDYLAPVTTTLGELAREWITNNTAAAHGTRITYRQAVNKHLLPEIAAVPIQQLKAHHIQTLYARLRTAGVGEGIMRQLHVVVQASLDRAVAMELIRRNPAKQVAAPVVREVPIRYWTQEQCAVFLQAESHHRRFGVFWELLVLTGMRSGEARALRWADIDLDRRTITITRTVTRNAAGHDHVGTTTKTRNSRRTIPLPASCVESLRRHKTAQRERQLAAATWEPPYGDLVFTNRTGGLMDYDAARRAFLEAVAKSGLPELGGMHGLRHTYATIMLLAGVHPKVVAELLGDTVAMILRVYSHVTVEARQDAVAGFDAAITRLREDMPVAADATT